MRLLAYQTTLVVTLALYLHWFAPGFPLFGATLGAAFGFVVFREGRGG